MKHFLLVLSFLSVTGFSAVEYQYLRIPRKLLTEKFVKSSGFIEDHFHNQKFVVGYLPLNKSFEIPPSITKSMIELDPIEWAHQSHDIETLKVIPVESSFSHREFEPFHTYETLSAELKTIAEKYPNLVDLQSAGKTVQGREMWYVRLTSKSSVTPSKPKVLYISSMHGDEVTGKEMMVYLIRDLLAKYGNDAATTALLDHSEVFIMPSMNPDGTQKSQRFNANGVDLNRDFPELNESPFGGNQAIETRNIMELHRENHFLVALNFHGGSLCVNIPWDSRKNNSNTLFEDNTLMLSMAHQYADANAPMKANHSSNFNHGVTYGYEWYPVYGGMQDWASFFRQSIHATIEISNTKWPNANTLPTFWNQNKVGLFQYLKNGLTGIHFKAVNVEGQLLDVSVGISSSKRALNFSGYVHRPSVTAEQQVTVSAQGYKTKTLSMTPQFFQGTYETVVLDRN